MQDASREATPAPTTATAACGHTVHPLYPRGRSCPSCLAAAPLAPAERVRCACQRLLCWHEVDWDFGCPSRVSEHGLVCGLCRARDN